MVTYAEEKIYLDDGDADQGDDSMSADESFEAWYERANIACVNIAGVGIDDLPDGPSWDAWNDGVDPTDYAVERLEEDGFPG